MKLTDKKNKIYKKAIVTLSMGKEAKEFSILTHPLIKDYANRINASFVIIDRYKLRLGSPHFEKFQIYELLNTFNRIIYLDTDIIITPRCPNLFDIVPEDKLGVFFENKFGNTHGHAIKLIKEELGDLPGWKEDYFNSGVMVISRRHKEIFNPNYGHFKGSFEQTQLNYNVQKLKIPTYNLGFKYNYIHLREHRDRSERFSCYIIHYAGCGHGEGTRIEQIKRDLKIIKENLKTPDP